MPLIYPRLAVPTLARMEAKPDWPMPAGRSRYAQARREQEVSQQETLGVLSCGSLETWRQWGRGYLAWLNELDRVRSNLPRLGWPSLHWAWPAALALALLAPPLTALANDPLPVGPEFRVNTYTTGHQHNPSVAMDADGDFVIVWDDGYFLGNNGQDGSYYGVYAQRYQANGLAQGSEFQINTYTTGHQRYSSVAMDVEGDFVVTWESAYNQDGSYQGIYAQRYNANGVAQGLEFQVNTYTTGSQRFPKVAMDADRDFVIVWDNYQDDRARAQRYNANGVAQGDEFRVSTSTTNSQISPSVAMDADGNFVITWHSYGQNDNNARVYAQQYDATGVPQGSEFQVHTDTTFNHAYPSIAMHPAGDFVIVWDSYSQGGSELGIHARQYNASGVAQGSEFQVNTSTSGFQNDPRVAIDAGGDFIVVWEKSDQYGGNPEIYAQKYNASSVAQGSEFRVNTYTTGTQRAPNVAMDSDGDFVVVWADGWHPDDGQDGSKTGVYAQRYTKVTARLHLPVILKNGL